MSLVENFVIYGNASIRDSDTTQGPGILDIQSTTAALSHRTQWRRRAVCAMVAHAAATRTAQRSG
jgi:hypothetical protein